MCSTGVQPDYVYVRCAPPPGGTSIYDSLMMSPLASIWRAGEDLFARALAGITFGQGAEGTEKNEGPPPGVFCGRMTFAEDVALRQRLRDDGGSAAAQAGLGLADIAAFTSERLTHGMRVSPDVNLGALKAVGHGTMVVGAGIAGYQAVYGETQDKRNLGRQDLAFQAFGASFPEWAPFVTLPYMAGRVVRDVREAAEASKPSILDAAAGCP